MHIRAHCASLNSCLFIGIVYHTFDAFGRFVGLKTPPKVVCNGPYLYFCRCGGQFYGIDSDIAQNESLTEKELLMHKRSFRIEKDKLKSVEIHSTRRYWTGSIPNNGSVKITAGKKLDFILHVINDAPRAEAFFNTALHCPVTVLTDPGQERQEALEAAFEAQSAQTKKRIKVQSEIINSLGILSGLWLFFYPRPIRLAVSAALLLPLLGLLAYIVHRQDVTLDEGKDSILPSIGFSFILPSIALFNAGLTGANMIYNLKIWALILALTGVLSLVVLLYKRQMSEIIVLPLFLFLYVLGAVTTTSFLFDDHSPQPHAVEALEKIHDSGDYTLVINNWREGKKPVKIDVSESLYQATEIGQNVLVYVFPGLWGAEWYRLFPAQQAPPPG